MLVKKKKKRDKGKFATCCPKTKQKRGEFTSSSQKKIHVVKCKFPLRGTQRFHVFFFFFKLSLCSSLSLWLELFTNTFNQTVGPIRSILCYQNLCYCLLRRVMKRQILAEHYSQLKWKWVVIDFSLIGSCLLSLLSKHVSRLFTFATAGYAKANYCWTFKKKKKTKYEEAAC